MGQSDINNLLRKNPRKWFIAKEIFEMLDLSSSSVRIGLQKMRKKNDVKFRGRGVLGDEYQYKFKE